jgi:hypothetical protein
VNFVDDIDLELSAYRREPNIFAQLAHLVDTVIAGAIDLENVEADALRDLSARVAYTAGIYGWSMYAIQRLGQDSRR